MHEYGIGLSINPGIVRMLFGSNQGPVVLRAPEVLANAR
jgi:hypothetical protein